MIPEEKLFYKIEELISELAELKTEGAKKHLKALLDKLEETIEEFEVEP